MQNELENRHIIENIVQYLKNHRKENPTAITFLDKGALLRTDKNSYYVKFDTLYWITAGRETGKFSGAGFALNTKYYNIIKDKELDILYTNRPNYVYYYKFKNYENSSFNHIQSFNGERVRVIAISLADDVWKV